MLCRAVGEIELVISSKTCNFASYSYRNILNSFKSFLQVTAEGKCQPAFQFA